MFKKLFDKFFNRETLSYVFFGILTTAVDFGSFWIFTHLFHIDSVIAIVPAWVLAVIFAFITNKIFVFNNRNFKPKIILREFTLFIIARLLSLLYALVWQVIAAKWMGMNDLIAKLLGNIVVLIINYAASKLIIFRKKEDKTNGQFE